MYICAHTIFSHLTVILILHKRFHYNQYNKMSKSSSLTSISKRQIFLQILTFLFRTFLNSTSYLNIFYKLRLRYEPFFLVYKNHKQKGFIKDSDIKH